MRDEEICLKQFLNQGNMWKEVFSLFEKFRERT